jgi:hypothetical protein
VFARVHQVRQDEIKRKQGVFDVHKLKLALADIVINGVRLESEARVCRAKVNTAAGVSTSYETA